jgi:hypothetical protein
VGDTGSIINLSSVDKSVVVARGARMSAPRLSLASGMGPPRCHDLGTTWAWL